MSRIKLATIGKNYAKHIEEELALLNKRLGLVGTSLHNLISPISMFLDYGRKLTNINPEVLENLATISDNLREFYGEISNKEDSLIEYLNKNKVAINNTISEIQKSLDITKPSLEDVSNFERSSEGWAKAKINYRKKIISQLIGDKFGIWNALDEIPALPNTFNTLEEAREAGKRFIERFKQQGFYKSADGYKIPFDSLNVATVSENDDACFLIVSRNDNPELFDKTWGG